MLIPCKGAPRDAGMLVPHKGAPQLLEDSLTSTLVSSPGTAYPYD